jgi:hypothetical protein
VKHFKIKGWASMDKLKGEREKLTTENSENTEGKKREEIYIAADERRFAQMGKK